MKPKLRLSLKIVLSVLALSIVISGGVYGYKTLRKYLFLDNFGVVENGRIYRSGQLLPFQLDKVISEYGIKTIIRANIPELSAKSRVLEKTICEKHNIQIIAIVMPGDGLGSFEQYDKAVEILRNPDNLPALVCCACGTHRTGAIIAGYRVFVQNWPVNKALKEMENYRFRPFPHRRKGKEHPLLPHLRAYFRSRLPGGLTPDWSE